MIRRDMQEVLQIERQSYEYPWTEEDFINCLRMRNVIGMVAEHDEQVVLHAIYRIHRDRFHIMNIAVREDMRRHGIGSQMISKLIGKLSSQRRNRITVNVRETNLGAQLFFARCGFRAVEVSRSHYSEVDEDAYKMVYVFNGE